MDGKEEARTQSIVTIVKGTEELMSKQENQQVAREHGVVKWFSAAKGYGFIGRDNGDDIFVHHTGITASGFRELKEGDSVAFEIEAGNKGKPQAVRVTKFQE